MQETEILAGGMPRLSALKSGGTAGVSKLRFDSDGNASTGPIVTCPVELDRDIPQGQLSGPLGFASSPEAQRFKRDGEVVEDSSMESAVASCSGGAWLGCRGFWGEWGGVSAGLGWLVGMAAGYTEESRKDPL